MADQTIVIDLSAPARASDLPALVRGFLGWWGRELAAFLPQSFRAAPRPRTTLLASGTSWRIASTAPGAQAAAIDPSLGDHALAEQIMSVGAKFELSRLEVLLPRADALVRQIQVPVMADADIRAAVELQIDRLSPFPADAARFAYLVSERDVAAGRMSVEVAIVPRSRVEPLEQRLQSLGLSPARIDIEGTDGTGAGFDLRQPASEATRRRRRIMDLSLALAAAVVWLFALQAWRNAGQSEIADWEGRVAELRPAAERTAMLRRRIDALSQPVAIANSHDPARALKVLDELTRVLPDDTRVLDLKLDGELVRIEGLSASAPDLIAKLEGSKLFEGVKFVSPLMRRPESTLDRFSIAMQLEARSP